MESNSRWGYLNRLSINEGWVFRVMFGDYMYSNFAPHKLFIPGRQVYLLFCQHSLHFPLCSVKRPKSCFTMSMAWAKCWGTCLRKLTHIPLLLPPLSSKALLLIFSLSQFCPSYSLFSPAGIDLSLPWLLLDSLSTLFTLTLEYVSNMCLGQVI